MMNSRNDDRNDYDNLPYSRLFVVCNKHHTKEDLMPLFENHGFVEDIYMPKDRNTGASKGIAFVKYKKTSSAAAAIEHLHMKCIAKDNKPLKVMVSANKSEGPYTNEEKFKRLFIKVPKSATEKEIEEHFSRFGTVNSVHLQKERGSDKHRGFGYVNYNTFLDAAQAFEQCDTKYKPIFATPKEELKRPLNNDEFNYHNNHTRANTWCDDQFEQKNIKYPHYDIEPRDTLHGLIKTKPQGFDTISVVCTPNVPQKCIEQLFNVVPGVVSFRYSVEYNESKAIIRYDSEVAAAHAKETLNYFEFPSGELITVSPYESPINQAANNLNEIVKTFKNVKDSSPDMLHLAEAIAQASSLIKAVSSKEHSDDFEYICGVKLPLVKPLANKFSRLAKRCFLILKPMPPPHHVLQNIFCRFGDLIDVSICLKKTYGFAQYASTQSADDAMRTLHGTILYGIQFKVIEADEKHPKADKMNVDNEESNMDSKRAKLNE